MNRSFIIFTDKFKKTSCMPISEIIKISPEGNWTYIQFKELTYTITESFEAIVHEIDRIVHLESSLGKAGVYDIRNILRVDRVNQLRRD